VGFKRGNRLIDNGPVLVPGGCAEIPRVNVADRLLAHPPEAVAVVVGLRSLSYGDLADQSARWRGGLTMAGIGPGDRVVVITGNDEVMVVAELALLGAGAVIVPLNPQSPPAELGRELVRVDPAGVIVGQAAEAVWAELVRLQPQWEARRLDPASWAQAEPAPIRSVALDAPAALMFTSGTAGPPQPAVLTHHNLDTSLQAMLSIPIDLLASHHVGLAVIPLCHIFGLHAVVNLGLTIGATLVLDDYRHPTQVAELVETHGVTILSGPPTLWQALAVEPELRRQQFASVALAVSGAAKLAPQITQAVQDRLGMEVAEGYGLTETCAVVATAIGANAPVGSVGPPLAGVEARLVDQGGNDVLVGDPGELWVRGPMVSPGYFGDLTTIAGTARVTAGGWLRTGDVAIVDDDGNLAIVDRLKDLVIVSGFNVFPGEVEAALVGHPDVAAAGVIGEPDPTTGEAVVAFVVPAPGRELDLGSLFEHCRAQLARYKVPHRIEIRAELPRGLGGKLRRYELH
jgi:long-chain acyl-CoA synthetase